MDHYSVAHAWAHDDYNRNGEANGHNVYATEHNRAIFSYGSHFCIARKTDSVRFHVLMTTRGYAVSTAKHLGYVRSAANHYRNCTFHCEDPGKDFHGIYQEEMKGLVDMVDDLDKAKAKKAEVEERIAKRAARKQPPSDKLAEWLEEWTEGVAYRTQQILDRVQELEDFRVEFKIKVKDCQKKVLMIRNKFRSDKWQSLSADEREFNRRALEKQREAQRRAAEERAQREAENLEKWLKGDPDVRLHYQQGAAKLRVMENGERGARVETNQGAWVPIMAAHALWLLVNRTRREGEDFIPDEVDPIKVGHYKLDRVSSKGNVKIGCHQITFEEMDRIHKDVIALSKSQRQVESV